MSEKQETDEPVYFKAVHDRNFRDAADSAKYDVSDYMNLILRLGVDALREGNANNKLVVISPGVEPREIDVLKIADRAPKPLGIQDRKELHPNEKIAITFYLSKTPYYGSSKSQYDEIVYEALELRWSFNKYLGGALAVGSKIADELQQGNTVGYVSPEGEFLYKYISEGNKTVPKHKDIPGQPQATSPATKRDGRDAIKYVEQLLFSKIKSTLNQR